MGAFEISHCFSAAPGIIVILNLKFAGIERKNANLWGTATINKLASTSILKEECFEESCLQETNATYIYRLLYSAIRWSLV